MGVIKLFFAYKFGKRLLRILMFFLLIALLTFLLNDQILQWVFQSNEEEVLFRVETGEKVVSLTFDALWDDSYSEELLNVLSKNKIKSTFFLTGTWIKNYPELTEKIIAEHEIGSHSYSHLHLTSLTEENLLEEVIKFEDVVKELTKNDESGINLFRPPYGEYDERLISILQERGYKVVMWSVESKDWLNLNVSETVDQVLANIHPGAVIIFRMGNKENLQSIPLIANSLRKQGYRIIPLSKMINQVK